MCLFLLVQSRFLNLSIKLIKVRTRNTPQQSCLIYSTIQILKLLMFFHDPSDKVFFIFNLFPNNKISCPKENYQNLQTNFQILTSALQESAQDTPDILLIFSSHLSLNTLNKVICIKLSTGKHYSLFLREITWQKGTHALQNVYFVYTLNTWWKALFQSYVPDRF